MSEELFHEPIFTGNRETIDRYAVRLQPNSVEVLIDNDPRYLKTDNVRQCIIFVAHNSRDKKLGVSHITADSNVARLIVELERRLGAERFIGHRVSILGGVKGDRFSEEIKKDIIKYCFDHSITINSDRTLRNPNDKESQNIIIDRETGETFRFEE